MGEPLATAGNGKFQVITTGDPNLDRVQQNVAEKFAAQDAAQASSGITLVSGNYTLQPTDRYLLVSPTSDTTIALGSPSLPYVSTIVNNGPKKCTVSTADGKTSFGDVAVNESITIVSDGKAWSKLF
jgi:hypothetical protein